MWFHDQINPVDYKMLSEKVWKDNDIQSALKEAYELLKRAKQSWNDELFNKFLSEYEELRRTILSSVQESKHISEVERAQIMLELWDVIELAQESGIKEKKWILSHIWDVFKWTDTIEAKNKSQSFREKSIDDYSLDEAIWALQYTNNNYQKYQSSNISASWEMFLENFSSTDSIDDIDTREEANIFQEKLIQKILLSNNSGFIQWYNKEKWNFLLKENDFIEQIKSWDIKEVNYLALKNLINKYWKSLSDKIWEEWISFLINYWLQNWNSNISKLLIENWALKETDYTAINTTKIEEIKKFSKVDFESLDDLFFLEYPEYIYNLSKEKIIHILKNDNFNLYSSQLSLKNINPEIIDIDIIRAFDYANNNYLADIRFSITDIWSIPNDMFNSLNKKDINILFSLSVSDAYTILIKKIWKNKILDYINDVQYIDKDRKKEIEYYIPDYFLNNDLNKLYTENKLSEVYKTLDNNNDSIVSLHYIDSFLWYKNSDKYNPYIINILNKLWKFNDWFKELYSMPNTISLILKDVQLTKHTLEIFPDFFQLLPAKERSNTWLIKTIIENLSKSKLKEGLFKYIEIGNWDPKIGLINLISIYKLLKNKLPEEKFKEVFNNSITKSKIWNFINNIKNIWDLKLIKESENIYNEIIDLVSNINKKLSELVETYNNSQNKNTLINRLNSKNEHEKLTTEQKIKEILRANKKISEKDTGKIIEFLKTWNHTTISELVDKISPNEFEQILNIRFEENIIQTQEVIKLAKLTPEEYQQINDEIRQFYNKDTLEIEENTIETIFSEFIKENKINKDNKDEIITLFIDKYKFSILWEDKVSKIKEILNLYLERIKVVNDTKDQNKALDSYKKGTSEEDFYKDLYENFDELVLAEQRKSKEINEKLEKEEQVNQEKNTGNEPEKIPTSNNENYTYNPETWTINIPETQEFITLSPEEQALAKNKPETLENIVNFYKFFKDLNLPWVWKYRKELTIAMWDVNININDDSLKKSELTRFANKLIAFLNNSLNTNLNENNISLSSIEAELRKITWAWSYFDGRTFNTQWEDILTADLRNLGIIGWACFHTMQFREILDWKTVDKKEKNI